MARVEFREVSKVFGDGTRAVDRLDLEITQRRVHGARRAVGLRQDDRRSGWSRGSKESSGDVRIGDRVVNDLSPKSRDIAMVFQSYALYPHLTVRDNVAFPLKMKRTPKDEIGGACRKPRESSTSSHCSGASPAHCRADSGSALRWAARSCASRRCSSWTSRCRTSTRSSVCRCARTSSGSRPSSA